MYWQLVKRLLSESEGRLLWKLACNAGYRGVRSVRRFRRRLRQGRYFPPFLYISITTACNLRCQGCWADVAERPHHLELARLDRLIRQAKRAGNSIFGLLGGEPLLHPDLFAIMRQHPDCYFQLFTNGHFVTDGVARQLRRLGNVTPLISIEGDEVVSDRRRGRPGVWNRTMAGLTNCLRHRLITGVCTSLCQSNFDELLSESWVDRLIELGVLYLWYYVYRPVGPDPQPQLALSAEQQRAVRRFVVEMRCRKPIIFIDTYYDDCGRALCPAATGISHHISPRGDIEPCPIVQFAKETINDPRGLERTFCESELLADFRQLARRTTRGCLMLERPDLMLQWVRRHGARDTTLRGTALAELEAMAPRPSQHSPGNEIPERCWPYRLAKRLWFNDFGAYDGRLCPDAAADADAPSTAAAENLSRERTAEPVVRRPPPQTAATRPSRPSRSEEIGSPGA